MKFSYKLPKSKIIKDRFEYLASIATNKSVLHVGCVDRGLLDQKIGTDKFLHHILDKKSKDITGIDIDLQGINKMKEYGYENVICADIEQWESDKKYEVIILGEIREHIDNCGAFLDSIKKNSDKDTLLAFTTPNAYYYLFWILICLNWKIFILTIIIYSHIFLLSNYSKNLIWK